MVIALRLLEESLDLVARNGFKDQKLPVFASTNFHQKNIICWRVLERTRAEFRRWIFVGHGAKQIFRRLVCQLQQIFRHVTTPVAVTDGPSGCSSTVRL